MSEIDRTRQWIMLLGGLVFVLYWGSRALAWLSSGFPSFEMRGVNYTGSAAGFCITVFGLAGLFMLVSGARNLRPWR